jgi:hypothetical protein
VLSQRHLHQLQYVRPPAYLLDSLYPAGALRLKREAYRIEGRDGFCDTTSVSMCKTVPNSTHTCNIGLSCMLRVHKFMRFILKQANAISLTPIGSAEFSSCQSSGFSAPISREIIVKTHIR